MSEPPDAIQRFQNGLEPYIKPREQTNYIRRILALHLESCSQGEPLNQPLALAGTSHDTVNASPSAGKSQGGYLEALRANAGARREFENVLQARPETPGRSSEVDADNGSILDERLAILKLEKKRQRLSTVRKYLDQLLDRPAASPGFLDSDQMLKGAAPLPDVPQETVNRLVAENSSSAWDLKSQAARLEKIVLRSKVLLRQEERLLEEAKARSRSRLDIASNSAKLEALNATRNELIKWIESELSMTSGGEPDDKAELDDNNGKANLEADQTTIAKGLAEAKEKYARYLQSRKELLELVSDRPQLSSAPDLKPKTSQSGSEPAAPPVNHILVPYIERLLWISRNQKALITQKSHHNVTLGKQTKEACQGLGHLAEESQLLPKYPMKDSQRRRRSGLVDELTSKKSNVPDLFKRITPWVFAADSAKIANLESIAETIEGGQVALEASMTALQDLESLLDLAKSEAKQSRGQETGADDVWLTTGGTKATHTETNAPEKKLNDIWSALHGNLGLIGQDDTA